MSDIRETVKSGAPMVVDETHSQLAVSWRTDRSVQNEESILDNKDAHDAIRRWVGRQQYISAGGCVFVHPY